MRRTISLLILVPNAKLICSAICGHGSSAIIRFVRKWPDCKTLVKSIHVIVSAHASDLLRRFSGCFNLHTAVFASPQRSRSRKSISAETAGVGVFVANSLFVAISAAIPPDRHIVDPWGCVRGPHPGLKRPGRLPLREGGADQSQLIPMPSAVR